MEDEKRNNLTTIHHEVPVTLAEREGLKRGKQTFVKRQMNRTEKASECFSEKKYYSLR